MNLVDLDRTPLHRAFEAVRTEAAAHGVAPTWSEIVGLVPEKVLFETAARHIQLRGFTPEMVLEHKVRRAVSGGESLAGFVASVASGAPVPGGGSVAAHVGALAAALAQMVAGLTIGRKKYAAQEESMKAMALEASALVASLSTLVQRDADAYSAVSNAYKLPKDTPEQITARDAAIQAALLLATEIPLETTRCCAAAAQHAASAARFGNTNAVSDAGVAALMANAAAKGAAYNVRINAKDLTDRAVAAQLIADTEQALQVAAAAAAEAEDCVTKALAP
jgi:glutamate formiminotransferase/formiminotetrahydrofolate cyclodeaminase